MLQRIFAGLTVIIALVGLSVVNIPFLTQMGIAAAATIVVAVFVARVAFAAYATVRMQSMDSIDHSLHTRAEQAAKPVGRFVHRRPADHVGG